MTDLTNAYKRQFNHLLTLLKTPGWGAYAKTRAMELEADKSRIWTGIVEDLKKSLPAGPEKPTESVAPKTEKRHSVKAK